MTDDKVTALYAELDEAHAEVARTSALYQAATARRAQAIRALNAAGQSFYGIAKRIGLSTSRIIQIANRDKEPEA